MVKGERKNNDQIIRSANLPFTPGQIVELPGRLDNSAVRELWLQQLKDPRRRKIIDLFCGAGGMSEGFVSAGFVVAAAFDHDPRALKTFAANIPARTVCTDIAEIAEPSTVLDDLDVSSIDVIIGGPPCQGFSQVGRARIRSLAEAEQTRLLARNELYHQYFRFVEAFYPSIFMMENVPNLATFEGGAYMEAIQRESMRLGYDLDYRIIDAVDHGVPQIRRRIFIVGSRIGRVFHWPRTIHERNRVQLLEAIGDLPVVQPPSLEECLQYRPPQSPSQYQQLMRSQVLPEDRDVVYDHVVRPVRQDDIEIFTHMKPGDRYIDIDPRYRRYSSESFKDKYYMLKPDAPGVTVTAHLDKDGYRYIHWDTAQHRTISIREAARIQSFGDHFRFAGSRSARFRQIGNAVPPLIAERLAEQVHRALRRSSGWLPGDTIQLALPGSEHQHHLVTSSE